MAWAEFLGCALNTLPCRANLQMSCMYPWTIFQLLAYFQLFVCSDSYWKTVLHLSRDLQFFPHTQPALLHVVLVFLIGERTVAGT